MVRTKFALLRCHFGHDCSSPQLTLTPEGRQGSDTVAVIPPQASMWLSLSITMLDSEYRWVSTPATWWGRQHGREGVMTRIAGVLGG